MVYKKPREITGPTIILMRNQLFPKINRGESLFPRAQGQHAVNNYLGRLENENNYLKTVANDCLTT